jgi:hypothetical protein
MGCYGQPPQYHINILPCIPDCDTTLTYQEMVDYFNSVTLSGVTVSGGVSYTEMVNYVSEHCVSSGISYEEMTNYVGLYCDTTASGLYIDLIEYINNITVSGAVTQQYVDNSIQVLCEHLHTDILTASGNLQRKIELLNYARSFIDGAKLDGDATQIMIWDGGVLKRETATISGSC